MSQTFVNVLAIIGGIVLISAATMLIIFLVIHFRRGPYVEQETVPQDTIDALNIVLAGRMHQLNNEKFAIDRDDTYTADQLAIAASCYLYAPVYPFPVATGVRAPIQWPWNYSWWKPQGGRMKQLEKAGGLLIAEIERQLRKQRKQHETRNSTQELS